MSILEKVHGGLLGNHVGGRTLAHKILRMGFYWPTMKEDAKEFAAKCVACQLCANHSHKPSAPLVNVDISWPFDQWGMDIVGPFPPATGQRKFFIVAVEYFTKGVEAEPLTKITNAAV